MFVGICIIKKGKSKLKYIEHNRNLIKDEDWKEIHMTVPKRIIGYAIRSMIFYIIQVTLTLFEWSMVHFGYSSYFFKNECKRTELGIYLEYGAWLFWVIFTFYGCLIIYL